MQTEEGSTVPLSQAESEMGVGIPPTFLDGISNYEIEDRVISSGRSFDYTREELEALAQDDACYQKIKFLAQKNLRIMDSEDGAIAEARDEVTRAFIQWQLLTNRRQIMKAEVKMAYLKLFHRMVELASNRASRSIKKLQRMLGIADLDINKEAEKSLTKLLGKQSQLRMETLQSLHEQSEDTEAPLESESPTIQS